MPNHCPDCKGGHAVQYLGATITEDCPGCPECERLLKAHDEAQESALANLGRFLRTERSCEEISKERDALRAHLALAERVVKAMGPLDCAEGAMANAYSHKDVTAAKATLLAARIEMDVALDAWEQANE